MAWKRKAVTSSFIVIVVLLSWQSLPTGTQVRTQEADTGFAWEAVKRYLAWQKFWFGAVHFEPCYTQLIGKKVPVTFVVEKPTSAFADSLPCWFCQTLKQPLIKVPSAVVQLSDYILAYHVIAAEEGTDLQRKTVTSLVTPKDPGNPPYDKPEDCQDFDTEKWLKSLPKQGRVPIRRTLRIENFLPHRLPPVEENLRNAVVLKAVQRSMARWLSWRYFETRPRQRWEQFSQEQLERVKQTKRVLLGRFRDDDPNLLVWYEGDDTVYEMTFPSKGLLADERLCMDVGYVSEPTYGFKDPTAIVETLKENLKKNAVVLELPNWGSTPTSEGPAK